MADIGLFSDIILLVAGSGHIGLSVCTLMVKFKFSLKKSAHTLKFNGVSELLDSGFLVESLASAIRN